MNPENRNRWNIPPCPFEEKVIRAFHDGEPGLDSSWAARHLEECPSCRRALEETRTMEALLAAHTVRKIADEEADLLLAFLPTAPAEKPGPEVLPLKFAALLLAALGLAVFAALPLPAPPPPDLSAGPVLDLPQGLRFPPKPKRKTSWTKGELFAFLGNKGKKETKAGASRPPVEALAGEALRLLREEGDPEKALQAARWVLEKASPRIRFRAVPALADRLLAAGGKERPLFAALIRKYTSLFFPSSKKKPGPRSSRLAGALGYAPALRTLASAPFTLQEKAAREALRTGDKPSLAFLLDLYLEASIRSSESRKSGREWFLHLTPRTATALLLLLQEKRKKAKKKYPAPLVMEINRLLGPLSLRAGGGL